MRATINLFEGRPDPSVKTWDLPAWGHPLARTVMPLFIRMDDRLVPAGTAFWIGRSVSFVLTAMHTVKWALQHEGRFDRELTTGEMPRQAELKRTALYVLHTEEATAEAGRISFIPLENLSGGPPGDVVSAILNSRMAVSPDRFPSASTRRASVRQSGASAIATSSRATASPLTRC